MMARASVVLPPPLGPGKDNEFVVFNGEADIVENSKICAVLVADAVAEIFQFQHRTILSFVICD